MVKSKFHHVYRYLKRKRLNLEKFLQNKLPSVVRFYRFYLEGKNSFVRDAKIYIKTYIKTLKTSSEKETLQKMSLHDIEIYIEMPKDIRHLIPLIIIFTIPVLGYASIPMALLFPRQLLSSHFWTKEQTFRFNRIVMKKKLMYYQPLLRHIKTEVDISQKRELYQNLTNLLEIIDIGYSPEVRQILACKDLFETSPFGLLHLRKKHVRLLLKIHYLQFKLLKKSQLAYMALILKEMDKALIREGGVNGLSLDSVRKACYMRGLNPVDMKKEDMVLWLHKWLTISFEIDNESLSLLLHCPVFLAHNEPSNLALIRD